MFHDCTVLLNQESMNDSSNSRSKGVLTAYFTCAQYSCIWPGRSPQKKKAAPPTQSRLTPFHSRNAVGWTWYSRDYLWHAPCKLHGSKSLYACFEALCPIYWKWVLDWIYLGFMSTWFSICDQKTCRLGEGSSFLPCLLPSFHPSILPLFLPSFLPSALPSFTETQKNRKKQNRTGQIKKTRANHSSETSHREN